MSNIEDRRMSRVRRKLAQSALRLMDSLDEQAIAGAPLNQRAAALGVVLDKLMKLNAVHPSQAEEEVIRIEYKDPDGTLHSTPYWAREDHPGNGDGTFRGSSLWEAFRKDGGGEGPLD